MNILFINSRGRGIYIFPTQANNNSNKKIKKLSNPWVQPDLTRSMWVELYPCDELGWIYFNPPWSVGSKNPLNLTQPNLCTPLPTNLLIGPFKKIHIPCRMLVLVVSPLKYDCCCMISIGPRQLSLKST